MKSLSLIATATFGLEALVAQELRDLGYEDISVDHGQVNFQGTFADIAWTNLWLRCSDRIRWKILEFEATDFDKLFAEISEFPWGEILPENAEFPVEGKSIKSQLHSVPACQSVTKKAIVRSLQKKYKKEIFPEDGPLYRIELSINKDQAIVTIDTTGPGLHKRGYRSLNSPAPLKETLAAGLLYISRWFPDIPLIDPFCGSGTIPIEAALMGMNIPPGLNRSFVSEKWPQLNKGIWENSREKARAEISKENREMYIRGFDQDWRVIKWARKNSKNAGVENLIHWQEQEVGELSSPRKYGKIVCNPPYGERLEETKTAENLYKRMGKIFSSLDTWSFYVLTPHPRFERLFGRKANKKRKLFNGNIKVDYFQFFGPKPPKKRGRL